MLPERIVINDNVFLNLIETDKFKTNCISVDFFCNLSEDSAALNALLPFVLSKGTEKYPNMIDITKKLDMLYGAKIIPKISKYGDVQAFGFISYPLKKEYTPEVDASLGVLDMIGEMINSPILENGFLSKNIIETEKRIMIDRIEAQINDKSHYSLLRCCQIMSEGEPYALLETGSAEQVKNITEISLTKQLNKIRSSFRTEICCVGHFDKLQLTQTVNNIFSASPRTPSKPLRFSRSPISENIKRISENQNIKQGKLCLGYRTSCFPESKDLPAYTVLVEVLSGSPISKLFTNVREKLSLCYYCSAISDVSKGIMIIASGINACDKDAAEKAISSQLEQCKNGDISDDELNSARKSLKNSIRALHDDVGSVKAWYLKNIISGISCDPFDFLDKLLSVTKDDIQRSAQKIKLDTVYFLYGTEDSK